MNQPLIRLAFAFIRQPASAKRAAVLVRPLIPLILIPVLATSSVTVPTDVELVSISSRGAQAIGNEAELSSISAAGRFVAFDSGATNLVPGDTNDSFDVFVRDRCGQRRAHCTPSTVRVSVASDGTQADRDSTAPAISADGRFVVFVSIADNLVSDDTNGAADIFLRDTCKAAKPPCIPSTSRLSVATDGTQGDFDSGAPAMSADGRFVAFQSFATNLVPRTPTTRMTSSYV